MLRVRLIGRPSAALGWSRSRGRPAAAPAGIDADWVGEARLRAVLAEAGLRRVRRATATPFNLVLEAGP
jgi:hypothetical protein